MNASRRVAVLLLAVACCGRVASQPTAAKPKAAAGDAAIVDAGNAAIAALRTNDLAALEARFDATMRRVFPHERVVETANAMARQFGAMTTCAEPTVRVASGVTVLTYRCEFEKAPMLVRLSWTGAVELAGLFYAPVPPPPAPLPPNVREESLSTGADGWPLPATLLVPTSRTKPPVAVLVHGSGPHDRDETIGPNTPFRDLAFGLASRGVATLRYDKRTKAHAARFVAELHDWTVDDEVVDDAVAALALVASRDDLGPVLLIGHSEGGLLAPRIAAAAATRGVRVAGLVMLAAPVTPLQDLVVDQYEFLSRLPVPRASPELVDDMKARRENLRRLLAHGSLGTSDALSAAAVASAPLPLDWPRSAWLDLGRYDPAAVLLARPGLPALLVFGGRDFQVPIAEKAAWESRLAGRPRTTTVAFPMLNHLLIAGDGPMTPAEYDRPEHVADALIDRVAAWIESGS